MMDDSLPRIDAASLVAFPAERPTLDRHSREMATARDLANEVLGGEPLLSHVWESAYGRVGTILLPMVDMMLFDERAETVAAALQGVDLATGLGAKCVSFTGMIPASTSFGRDIAAAIEARGGARPPRLTTGHAAVVAAFAFNVETILETCDRAFADESAVFVGIGSIGAGILRLLTRDGAPKKCTLVDVHAKKAQLANYAKRIGDDVEVVVIDRDQGLPDGLYDEATLILSATSTPLVVDVTKLRPGTLVVDDSFPFGFDSEAALQRISTDADIMLTIAGGFRGPRDFSLVYTNPNDHSSADFAALLSRMTQMINPWPDCMTGCVYSSLLTGYYDLPETIGPVTYEGAHIFRERLGAEGFRGTPPHIFTFDLTKSRAIREMPDGPLARPGIGA
jgi:hypothetical protein